jgi:predicted amidohydrolase
MTADLEKGLDFCREAKALGSDLVVFPELWSIGGGSLRTDQPRWNAVAIDQQAISSAVCKSGA